MYHERAALDRGVGGERWNVQEMTSQSSFCGMNGRMSEIIGGKERSDGRKACVVSMIKPACLLYPRHQATSPKRDTSFNIGYTILDRPYRSHEGVSPPFASHEHTCNKLTNLT